MIKTVAWAKYAVHKDIVRVLLYWEMHVHKMMNVVHHGHAWVEHSPMAIAVESAVLNVALEACVVKYVDKSTVSKNVMQLRIAAMVIFAQVKVIVDALPVCHLAEVIATVQLGKYVVHKVYVLWMHQVQGNAV